jgi:hypothetical protein
MDQILSPPQNVLFTLLLEVADATGGTPVIGRPLPPPPPQGSSRARSFTEEQKRIVKRVVSGQEIYYKTPK